MDRATGRSLFANIFRVAVLGTALACTGCASSIEHWIVATRDHQGDLALDRANWAEASLAYQLSLKLDSHDQHARDGLATVQTELAEAAYRDSQFDRALAELAVAAKYDSQSVRAEALKSQIENAKLKQEIVLSNYPTYYETGQQLRSGYDELRKVSVRIVSHLQRFDYSYDTTELTNAIRNSYDLESETSKLTTRLVSYRELIEAGTPRAGESSASESSGSLLPLP